MAQTFKKKNLVVSIFSDDGKVTTFDNSSIKVSIKKVGGAEYASAKITIFGVSLATASRLTWATFRPNANKYHLVEIQAGAGNDLSYIFKGEVIFCAVNLNDTTPMLTIEAHTGGYFGIKPDPPVSVAGSLSVSDFIRGEVEKMEGFNFENLGVDATISDCSISGTPIQKIRTVAESVGATVLIDDSKVILMPSGASRTDGKTIPVVDKDSGLIGYPVLTTSGVSVACFFRPDLELGGLVKVNTIVPACSGVWAITELNHELSANVPSGTEWTTTFSGVFNG